MDQRPKRAPGRAESSQARPGRARKAATAAAGPAPCHGSTAGDQRRASGSGTAAAGMGEHCTSAIGAGGSTAAQPRDKPVRPRAATLD